MTYINSFWFLVIGLVLFFFEDYPILSRLIAGLIFVYMVVSFLKTRRQKYKDIEDDLDVVEAKSKYSIGKSKENK